MNKGVDLIQRVQSELIEGYPTGNLYIGVTEEEYEELNKELKALEIIKEKGIDILEFGMHRKANTYNKHTKRVYCKDYTDEEFDLLKEVLK